MSLGFFSRQGGLRRGGAANAPRARDRRERATARIIPMWRPASTISRCCFRTRTASPRPNRSCAAHSRSTRQSYGPDHPDVAIRPQQSRGAASGHEPPRRGRAVDAPRARDRRDRATARIIPSGDRLNNLAVLLQDTNRLAEAEPLMRRALAIDEQSYGPDHPKVAIDLGNLAHLLQATNRLAEAEPLLRRALAIDESESIGAENHSASVCGNTTCLKQSRRCSASGHEPLRRGRTADAPRARDRREELRSRSSQCGDPPQQSRAICFRPRTASPRPSR